jgi:hypothetical protein
VRCSIVNAADVNKPRVLSEEEAQTWCGLQYAGRGQIKPGGGNPIALVGFDIKGPAVLLGNPGDNPLMKFLADQGFLPYAASADFPGRGRGMIAWQMDAIGYGGQESITAIGYDADGMSEAVGTLYEAAAGLDPLTKWTLPVGAAVTPAAALAGRLPELPVLWQASLPDRAVWIRAANREAIVCTWDGSITRLDAAGKALGAREAAKDEMALQKEEPAVPPAITGKLLSARVVKKVAAGANGLTAVVYWGGALQLFDAAGALKAQQMLPQDVAAVAWGDGALFVGLADGRVCALGAK